MIVSHTITNGFDAILLHSVISEIPDYLAQGNIISIHGDVQYWISDFVNINQEEQTKLQNPQTNINSPSVKQTIRKAHS